jgi:hypothetical protein
MRTTPITRMSTRTTTRSPGARPGHRRTPARTLGALLLGGVLAAGAAGCGTESGGSGGDGAKGGTDTALARALAAVPAPLADRSMTFRNVTTARRLVAADRELYGGLAGYGIPELGQYAGDPKKDWGFDETRVKTSLLVSQTPTSYLTGTFDPDAISGAMTRHGYRVTKDDAGVHLRKPGMPLVDASTTVRVERNSEDSPVLPLTPPEVSVADDAAYRAVTGCLGDTYEATVYGKHAGRNKDVVLLGIGGRAGAGNSSSETLCAVTASKGAAEATAKALREKMTATGKPYAGSDVTVGDGDHPVVSMTWKNKAGSGLRPGDSDMTLRLPRLLLRFF